MKKYLKTVFENRIKLSLKGSYLDERYREFSTTVLLNFAL
jgi:hypothetical protein